MSNGESGERQTYQRIQAIISSVFELKVTEENLLKQNIKNTLLATILIRWREGDSFCLPVDLQGMMA